MRINLFLLICITGLMFTSCNINKKPGDKTIFIGAITKPCTAGVMETECMQIKWTKDQTEWENFYGEIEGFIFEKGYEYELVLSEEKVENPPAGGSSVKYKLVKEVSKRKAESQDNAFGDNSKNSLDWQGTYSGILPCADCEGIKTTVTLNADGTFGRTKEYLGKNEKPFSAGGKFEWNKEGNVITLTDSSSVQKYQVGENQLFHLDNSGNQIKGDLAEKYILRKKDNVTEAGQLGFEDKKWMLVNFMGKEINESEDEYYISFNSKDKRLNTKTGCNVMNAGYELTNELNLKIGPVMSTRMACPENSIEDEYSKNLITVNNITTNGELLNLNRARMTIATFKLIK